MTTTTAASRTADRRPCRARPRPRPFGAAAAQPRAGRRSLIKIRRTPEQLLDVTLQPIIFVRAVRVPARRRDRRLHRTTTCSSCCPAIMVQTVLFASHAPPGSTSTPTSRRASSTGSGSLPIARSAPLIGAVVGRHRPLRRRRSWCCSASGTSLGLPDRHRPAAGAGRAACWSIVFAFCLSAGSSCCSACSLREPGAVQGIGFLVLFPLTFGSNMLVPTDTLPGWLQAWVKVNPVDPPDRRRPRAAGRRPGGRTGRLVGRSVAALHPGGLRAAGGARLPAPAL